MATRIIVTILSLSVLCCHMLSQQVEVQTSVANTIFSRGKASFCDSAPQLVETTRPFFPFAALAQVESHAAGAELLALLEEAERRETEFGRRYGPQRIVLRGDAYRRALISGMETKKVAGCYAELSPLIENPYRPGESGAFLRIFRGGAVGRSGSTTFWLAVNSDGSVARFVPLPLFVD